MLVDGNLFGGEHIQVLGERSNTHYLRTVSQDLGIELGIAFLGLHCNGFILSINNFKMHFKTVFHQNFPIIHLSSPPEDFFPSE